jgi:hypothetical protein
VKELIPVQQILQTYMSQESRDIDLDGEVQDTIDPDVFDGREWKSPGTSSPPMEEEPQETAPMGSSSRTMPLVSRMSSRLFQVFKLPRKMEDEPNHMGTNDSPSTQAQPQKMMMGVLFGDAPEQRIKKTGIIKWNSPTISVTP